MSKQEQAPRCYTIIRDGEARGRVLTMPDAYHYLHTIQGQSVEWAIQHEGYDIIMPDGELLSDILGLKAEAKCPYCGERDTYNFNQCISCGEQQVGLKS